MLNKTIQMAGGHTPADLLLKNVRLVNVFTAEIQDTSIAIGGGRIVGLGDAYTAHQEIDMQSAFVAPGFIDAHVHIESSMLEIPQFTRAVLPLGTTSVVTDPHEIANVLGYEGIRYMMETSKYNPLNVYFMLSSCVPASNLETSGSELRATDLLPLFQERWVRGLGEMMNYPGVVNADPEVLDKLKSVGEKRVDGHAPGLTGSDLNAYVGAGVESDHECMTADEAMEKLKLGMYIMIREGSGAKNLDALLPIITPHTERRLMFCTDDRHPNDILAEGHINYIVKTAIGKGVDPITAIRMATLNTADYFGLKHVGGIAPGRLADMIVFDDLHSLTISQVYKNGELVAKDGAAVYEPTTTVKNPVRSSVNIKWLEGDEFKIPATGSSARVIKVVPGQIYTETMVKEIRSHHGFVISDTENDILRMFVLERHRASGNIGKGLIHGLGLKSGALACTVAHDSHNIIAVGVFLDQRF